MKVYIVLFTFVIFLSAFDASGTDRYANCFSGTVWEKTNDRSTDAIARRLSDRNADILEEGRTGDLNVPGSITPYSYRRVSETEMAVLSLGEGGSSYISDLIKARRAAGLRVDNIHAVDVTYKPSNLDRYWVPNYIQEKTRTMLEEFPDHYHGQAFQQLDLVDAAGKRRRFKEIHSVHALAEVIGQADPSEALRIFRRVLDHLEPGGILRSYGEDLNLVVIMGYLGQLQREGLLTDYFYRGETLIIRK